MISSHLEGCRFGLQRVSMNDYPGLVAAVLFVPGCNLRCPYCHNASLVQGPYPEDLVSFSKAMDYLRKRKNVLGGVCISGGEPTLLEELPDLVDALHGLGYPVKLDTNGTVPQRLAALKVDFIAMDIKTTPSRYPLMGKDYETEIRQSIEWIQQSKIPHQFRTTVVPGLTTEEDLEQIARLVSDSPWVLHNFRNGNCLDPSYSQKIPFSQVHFLEWVNRYTPGDRSLLIF